MHRLTYILILLTITCLFGCQEETPQKADTAKESAIGKQATTAKTESALKTKKTPMSGEVALFDAPIEPVVLERASREFTRLCSTQSG